MSVALRRRISYTRLACFCRGGKNTHFKCFFMYSSLSRQEPYTCPSTMVTGSHDLFGCPGYMKNQASRTKFSHEKPFMSQITGYDNHIFIENRLMGNNNHHLQPHAAPCWFSTCLVPLWSCQLRSRGAACLQRRTAGLDKVWPARSPSASHSSQRGLQLETSITAQLK